MHQLLLFYCNSKNRAKIHQKCTSNHHEQFGLPNENAQHIHFELDSAFKFYKIRWTNYNYKVAIRLNKAYLSKSS